MDPLQQTAGVLTPDPLDLAIAQAKASVAAARASGRVAEDDALDEYVDDFEDDAPTDSLDSGDDDDETEDDESDEDPDGEPEAEAADSEDVSDPASNQDEREPEPEAEPEELPRGGKKLKKANDRLAKDNQALKERLTAMETEHSSSEERILQRIRDEQKSNEELRIKQSARDAEDRAADRIVAEMIGTREEVDQLIDRVSQGDPLAAQRLQEVRVNKMRLDAMMNYARSRSADLSKEVYVDSSKGLANVDPKILHEAHIEVVVPHLHEAGVVTGRAEQQAEVDRLTKALAERDQTIEDLQSEVDQDKPKRAAKGAKAPLAKGKSIKPKMPSVTEGLYDEDGWPVAGAITKLGFYSKTRHL